jgi:hypothetical protein
LIEEPEEPDVDDEAPRLFAAWMTVLQADMMLGHLVAAGTSWPEANVYCHACITSLRSVTLLLQKAFRHDPGFEEWYLEVQGHLGEDPEFAYLLRARNYVLKEGALRLMASYRFEYTGPLHFELRGIGPDGPDVWVSEGGESELVPADWRRLEGLKFDIPLRLGPVEGLPTPPERELREMLREKIAKLRLVLHEAEARFDPDNAETGQAAEEERALGHGWRE